MKRNEKVPDTAEARPHAEARPKLPPPPPDGRDSVTIS